MAYQGLDWQSRVAQRNPYALQGGMNRGQGAPQSQSSFGGTPTVSQGDPGVGPQGSDFYQPTFGENDAEGWEARQQALIDRAMGRYGLGEFMKGGAYAPEQMRALTQQTMGATPMMSGPSVSDAMNYGQGAMDLASRSAAVQAGSAIQGLRDRVSNPAALAVLGSQIAQQASSNVGAAGSAGYGQGLQMLNQASMANQDAQMRDRLAALGMLESSMGRAYGIGSAGMGALIPATLGYWQQRNDNKQAQNGMWGKVLGGMASMGTLLLQDKMRNQNPDGMGSGTPYEPNPYG